MDYLTFISELFTSLVTLIGSCAWPITILLIATTFRNAISQIILRLTEFELPGFKGKLRERIEEIKEKVEELQPPTPTPELQSPAQTPDSIPSTQPPESHNIVTKKPLYGHYGMPFDVIELAEISPTGAILTSWVELESAIDFAFNYSGDAVNTRTHPSRYSLTQKLRVLVTKGIINDLIYGIIDDLRRVRNEAAHGQSDVTSSDAIKYSYTAHLMSRQLRDRIEELSSKDPTST
jgi:hypothetical protein